MFEQYNIAEGVIHSSSDGQKYGTQFDTIRSRYSPKYFGLGKGISSCTLVANHVPINARIIGANEHESHFVFDLLFNNTSDIIPDRHSTDAHGSNQVNFATLYFYDYMFAPRFPKLHKKTETLYGFKPLKEYQDYLIKPTSVAKEELIIEEWENVQKIMMSLGLKSATQATIIRKLSSYKRKNKSKKALWELDNIFRTLYLLEYIDSLELRRSVQTALNRGEAYNSLKKAVFYAYGGKFRVKTELEQHIWSECCRLVTNGIIYYNTYILSELLGHMQKAGRFEEANLLKRVSPIAWQHINLYEKYEFPTEKSTIDIQEIRYSRNYEKSEVRRCLGSITENRGKVRIYWHFRGVGRKSPL
jgi:TnpA family transposase